MRPNGLMRARVLVECDFWITRVAMSIEQKLAVGIMIHTVYAFVCTMHGKNRRSNIIHGCVHY